MIKKLLLLMLILIPLATAVQITPNQQELTLTTISSKNAYVNITNNFLETIHMITLSSTNNDIQFIDNNFSLENNQTKEVKMVVDTSDSYQENAEISVIYFTHSDVINTPTDEYVTIDDLGFSPPDLEVFANSNIHWQNNDVLKHSVSSTLFDQDIEADSSWNYVFSESGIYEYQDKYTSFYGKIIVKSLLSEEYVHNPEDDQSFHINIISKKIETELSINYLETDSFTIEIDDSIEDVLVIENTGEKTAELVKLKATKWITFGVNDFYLESGKKKYVPYTISPLVVNSEQTDKEYNLEITASGNNTDTTTLSIKVFIPYRADVSLNDTAQQLFNQSFDAEFILTLYNAICSSDEYKEHPNCKQKTVEKIIYKSPPLPYNYSQSDIHNEIKERRKLSLAISDFITNTNAKIDTISSNTEQANTNSKETKLGVEELKKEYTKADKSGKSTAILIMGISIALLILSGIGFLLTFIYKFIKRKNAYHS